MVFENKVMRTKLERGRKQKETIGSFSTQMSLGQPTRRRSELAAKQEALDQSLAGPSGAQLRALKVEVRVLTKRLQECYL